MKNFRYFITITAAYILCHGITANLITPIQQLFLSDVTIFASLVYLPHGVRILATWLWGWKAFFPLYLGAYVSQITFTSESAQAVTDQGLLYSIALGATCALVAFEVLKFAGLNLYAGRNPEMSWKWLLIVGVVASAINSAGQTLIYSGVILPEHATPVFLTYAVGDLMGLFVSMVALMFIFRWIRLSNSKV